MKQYETHFGKLWLRDELDLFGFTQNGCYEPQETKVVQEIVKPGFCCLDIGANIGYYTVLMAELGAWVDCFEPNQCNVVVLEQNVQKYDRVSLRWVAVSDTNGFSNIYQARVGEDNINHGMHRMYKSHWCKDEPQQIKTITIDSLEKEHVDFVKIDVEGWEHRVLNGMYQTIERLHPIMLIEFHPPTLREAGSNPYHVYTLLQMLGYKIYLIPNLKNPISYEELLKETEERSGQNILCLYAGK